MYITKDRRVIGSYDNYADAERAVDYLSDRGFPVERVTIVGHDLQLVERVLGRVGYKEAMLRGASGGALTGVLIGWLFGLFNWIDPILASALLALYGLVFGAIVGAALGALAHWAQKGRRDFASIRVMLPSRYEVLVDSEVADQALELLNQASPIHGKHQSGV
ncbi:MAG: hypothetical protein QOF87_2345 [Pseudonocardiales bacterium]|jgi:hypothetical protein|nr:hypothetical protein [Pseudonocardiales bacterium]